MRLRRAASWSSTSRTRWGRRSTGSSLPWWGRAPRPAAAVRVRARRVGAPRRTPGRILRMIGPCCNRPYVPSERVAASADSRPSVQSRPAIARRSEGASCRRSPGRSATSPSSATVGRGRRPSSSRCCSRAARRRGSARSPTGRPSRTTTTTRSAARCRSRRRSPTATWEGRRLNLIDTPGDPSFQGDALGALRVVEGAVFEISGVAGVEVSTDRLWRRADELGLPRVVHVNLLDRERADFDAALASLKRLSDWVVAVAMPMGQEHDYGGVIDLVHMKAYPDPEGGKRGRRRRDPGGVPGGGAAPPRRADREGRRVGRRADREVPRGRGDHGRGDGGGAEGDGLARHHVPGHLRRGDAQLRHARAARPDRRGAAVAEARGRREGRQQRRRGARARASTTAPSRTSSRRSPTRSRASCRCSASSPARSAATRSC